MALKSGTIWHLSDLHLQSGWAGGDPAVEARVKGLNTDAFTVDAQNAFFAFIAAEKRLLPRNRGARLADVLVVSGDLVHQSGWVEAKRVHDFMERLRTALDLEKERVLVVPGNHDVNLATARTDPIESRREFEKATTGYRTVTSDCESVVFDEPGLAFLLVDTVSHVGVAVNLDKVVEAVLRAFPELPKDKLIEAVENGVSTEVPAISTTAITVALRAIATNYSSVLSASGSHLAAGSIPRLPTQLLGFLVSHYPLLPCPFTNVEVRPFHLPVGAGPAKGILSDAGVYVCLHGHQHVPWVHSEKTSGGVRDVRFVCVGAGSLTQDDRAFNIIRYTLMTDTGEARVAVQPVYVTTNDVQLGRNRPFQVPPRVGNPARAIRLIERIGDDGLVRGDKWFSDISTVGWSRDSNSDRRVSSIPVHIQTDQGGPTGIEVKTLTDGFNAKFVPAHGKGVNGALSGAIRVDADANKDRGSLAYREFNRFAYCASIEEKARCCGGAWAVPDLRFDEEALVHVVQVPCERLEISVRTPYPPPARSDLRLVTYIEDLDGHLVARDTLARMTEFTVESWPEARIMQLSVPRPMQGAAYGIAWRLPRSVQKDAAEPDAERARAIRRGCEALRIQMLECRKDVARSNQFTVAAWTPFIESVRAILSGACPSARESAEIALLAPDQKLLSLAEYEKDYCNLKRRPEVHLRPVLSSYSRSDPRYNSHVTVGLGVAGLAYATNRVIRYDSSKFPQGYDRDGYSAPSPYLSLVVNGSPLLPHSKLYAYPLTHPELRSMPIGCICIGSLDGNEEVVLDSADVRSALDQLIFALGESAALTKWRAIA